jgi:hypothetical protein
MKFSAGLLIFFLLDIFSLHSQQVSDITIKNRDIESVRLSRIKSKNIVEYHYVKGDETALADSGYKSFYFGYDENGRMTEYSKYHVFTDLTIKEIYQYGKNDKITVNTRYNAKNDRIETITYKYNKKGMLKSQTHEAYYNSVRTGVYFSIAANVNESDLFARVQDDLQIEPHLESYTIIININDSEELNQYIVIGDEADPTSLRYSWSQLSMESQRDLLAYTGPNRKEHEYISKFLSSVIYKYDSKGNLTGREVYNTAGDMLDKESFRYDTENRRTGYTRYNENSKPRSGENYIYDAGGKLSESIGVEPGGASSGKLQYRYDDSNNLTEKRWFNSAGEINGRFTYLYDNENRLIEETRYRGESEREFTLKYSYNEKGNVADIVKYDVNGQKEKLIRYLYEYY